MATSQSTTSPQTDNPPRRRRTRPRTEEEFLARHEALALQGILRTSTQLGTELLQAADLRAHVRRHPLLAVVLGSAGGFFAGRAAIGLLRHLPGLLNNPQIRSKLALNFSRWI